MAFITANHISLQALRQTSAEILFSIGAFFSGRLPDGLRMPARHPVMNDAWGIHAVASQHMSVFAG